MYQLCRIKVFKIIYFVQKTQKKRAKSAELNHSNLQKILINTVVVNLQSSVIHGYAKFNSTDGDVNDFRRERAGHHENVYAILFIRILLSGGSDNVGFR